MNSDNLIGKTLGTCTLEKLIGQGGMGVVYLARQVRPSRTVAVKVLFPNITLSSDIYQEFLTRFRREADLIAELEHINIMPIYEYGEQDGLAYLVMPHIPGGSLRDVLARNRALTLPEASNFINQAASALDYAHMYGVIHRDIKPSNFLLHSDGRLILTDFGIARITHVGHNTGSTLTSTGSLLGTPEYMAPEMIHGLPIDHRADIYELGIVLFQMLTGHVPFTGDTPLVVAVKHIHETLPSPHHFNPALPATVNTILQKATAKNPADRYPSAGAFAQALQLTITPSSTPSEMDARNAPTIASSPHYYAPAIVASAPIPPHNTPLPVSREATTEASYTALAHSSSSLLQAEASRSSVDSSKKRSFFVLVLISCIFIAVAIGTVAGLHLRNSLATNSQTGTSTPKQQILVTPIPTTQPTSVPTVAVTQPPRTTSAQQAQTTVQQYYNDINAKDYWDAYNLLGGSLHSSASYDQFASGYANTQHDDITFSDITPLSNGNVKVVLTLVATEQTSSGTTTTSTYRAITSLGGRITASKCLTAISIKPPPPPLPPRTLKPSSRITTLTLTNPTIKMPTTSGLILIRATINSSVATPTPSAPASPSKVPPSNLMAPSKSF